MTLIGLLLLLIVAAICGSLGRAIAGDVRGGLLASIAVGFIGALLGPWVAGKLGIGEPLMVNVSGHPFPVVLSIVGAAIFIALIHLVSRRP
jgi:uncharacterized membrane protein YeaQ/YmgE (transglycosylase-associated protein family)